MVLADDEQAGVLALRASVRLKRYRRKAGDLRELSLELLENDLVSRRLLHWSKGVHPRKRGPGNREHFRSGVELHRARAERNHRIGQRQIPRLQAVDVTQHLGLRVVRVEDGVLQKWAAAGER